MQSLMTDELNYTPTEVEMAVSLISKSGQQQTFGLAHAVSVRLPTLEYSTARAMAEHSGQSMNRVICALLRVGIDSVQEHLPADDANAIHKLRAQIIEEVLHPGQERLQLGEGD